MGDVVGGRLLEDPLRHGIPQDTTDLRFWERSSDAGGEVFVGYAGV